jgi:hypothetical protein
MTEVTEVSLPKMQLSVKELHETYAIIMQSALVPGSILFMCHTLFNVHLDDCMKQYFQVSRLPSRLAHLLQLFWRQVDVDRDSLERIVHFVSSQFDHFCGRFR